MSKEAMILALALLGAAGCSRTPNPHAAGSAPALPGAAEGAGSGPVAAAPTLVIPAGSQVHVRLDQSLSTKQNRAGDQFEATLESPILVQGQVAVPRGTRFRGHVVEARPSGRLKGRASIEVALTSFQLDGVTYPVTTGTRARTSSSHKKRNLALIGGGSGVGAAIGAIASGGTGALIGAGAGAAAGVTTAAVTGRKNVSLPAETPMTFSLRSQVAVRTGGGTS